MKEVEEWKSPDIQKGDYDTPINISLSSHCGLRHFGPAGCSGLELPLLLAQVVSGCTAQQELEASLASCFSK